MPTIVVQSPSRVQLFATPWTVALQASVSLTISQSLPKVMSTESGMATKPSHPLPLSSPFAFNLSQHQGLSIESVFTSGGQNIGVSSPALPMNIQGLFPLGFTGLILLSKGLSRVFSGTAVLNHEFFGT